MAITTTDLLGATSDPEIRNAVWLAAAGLCLACGVQLLPSTGDARSLHVDHVIPRHHGGQDRLSNYQALCRGCNLRKGASHRDYRVTAEVAEALEPPAWWVNEPPLIGAMVRFITPFDKGVRFGMVRRWEEDTGMVSVTETNCAAGVKPQRTHSWSGVRIENVTVLTPPAADEAVWDDKQVRFTDDDGNVLEGMTRGWFTDRNAKRTGEVLVWIPSLSDTWAVDEVDLTVVAS